MPDRLILASLMKKANCADFEVFLECGVFGEVS
jgi:hypothetical protein